jgi:ABC-2 type transport system ATP-binding protein
VDRRPRGDVTLCPVTVLQTRGLRKRFGAVEVLRGLDLSVGAGEVYGFLGRNGAGKSTTIRILMGLMRPDGGDVRLLGRALEREAVALRAQVGYVAQEPAFYPWMTVAQVARFLRHFYPRWDAGEFERLRSSMELPPKRRIGVLSGGMKRKLALALALAHRPPLLILDEPTAGLDPVARREFLERVREDAEATGRTTFFSTHLIDEIELIADRVGIVEDGRTRFEGAVAALAARVRVLRLAPEQEPPPPSPGVALRADRTFRGVREAVYEAASPEAFAAFEAALGRPLEALPLEEIFIALVRRDPAEGAVP